MITLKEACNLRFIKRIRVDDTGVYWISGMRWDMAAADLCSPGLVELEVCAPNKAAVKAARKVLQDMGKVIGHSIGEVVLG